MNSLDPGQIEMLAAELWRAETLGAAVPLPSTRYSSLSWADARAVARAVDDLRRGDGHRLIGYKLGWTSAVMREALGIDRPNWGTLWDYQKVDGAVDVSRLRHPKVEPELVYRCGRDLVGPDVDRPTVLGSADGWALGCEIVHPRYPDFGFTWLDNTADNSSCQAVVVGSFARLSVDPAEVEIEFGNQDETRTGGGAAAMGSPAEAVAWLVRSLHEEGEGLAAGDIVFTGGLAAPFDLMAGDRYDLRATGLEAVGFVVTAS